MVVSVAVPLIAPRRWLGKGIIDSNTVIDLTCPTSPGADIFYTTDGSKPTERVSRTINTRTYRYDGTGILLRQGKRAIKAIAVLSSGRSSNIITKEFVVQWAPSESDEEDQENDEIHEIIEASRESRLQTSRTMMDTTRTVGNDVLFRRVATGERLPTTNQAHGLTLANTRVMNETKMHAYTGPIQSNFSASYGPSQYDLPPPPKLNGNLIRCSGCGRVNNPDSRYCDWCGALPGAQETWETVPFPIRPKPMQPTPRAVPTLVTRNGSTQTVGLFYPGGHRIQKESDEIFQKMERQTTALANSKAMSAISPGNGKWNQQIDHINQHLKTYAQQNKAFREAISEPRLEKIIGAEIHDEEDVIQVRMTFPIARDAKGKYVPRKEAPKKVAFGSTTFEEPKKPQKSKKEEIPAEERILLNELKKKRCNLERVEECLAAGADPNIKDEHGTPALSIAVSNYHFEAAKQIIETKSFSITYRSTEDQNTFLHLAVMAGESPESIYLVDLLLQKGATERKNKAGELPSDIARKYRYTKFLELLEPELVSSKSASKAASKAATPSTKSTPRAPTKSPTPNSRPPSSHSHSSKPASEKSTSSRSSVSEKSNKPKSARSGSVSSARSRPMSNRSSVLDGF